MGHFHNERGEVKYPSEHAPAEREAFVYEMLAFVREFKQSVVDPGSQDFADIEKFDDMVRYYVEKGWVF